MISFNRFKRREKSIVTEVYATNIEIYDYIKAQRSLHISANGKIVHNPSFTPGWFLFRGKSIKIDGGETLSL